MQKVGCSQLPPRNGPIDQGVRSLTLEVFEQAPQINKARDDEGARIRAYPQAHQLEGAPHVVFKSQQGQLVGGIPSRESFRSLGP
jgi:hypothetical protein